MEIQWPNSGQEDGRFVVRQKAGKEKEVGWPLMKRKEENQQFVLFTRESSRQSVIVVE